ncbi:DUF2971 domain-containing protein [Methylobacter luteus]|uniref:DUF2971 domain-containing protein n=1 Tax=Methylobacter luteus TaxID=415 RepID=UPI000426B0BB|nr:DUF2971 domain-containing protein [Methylobacter luteus]
MSIEISLKNISSIEKLRGRNSNTLKVTRNDNRVLFIPENGGNRDYRVVQEWVAAGNKILPPPPKSKAEDRPDTAFLPHPNLNTPEDSQIVWRYMSFEQFVSLLLNKSLWFARGSILKNLDRYEGQLPERNLKIPPEELMVKLYPGVSLREDEIRRFVESHRMFQEIVRVNTLVNCWNMFDHESHSMWKVYGKGNNSIAIKSNIGALKKSFGDYRDYDVLIGEINYIDYTNELIDETNYLNILFHKTPFFSAERELRCVIGDDGDISLFPESEPYFWGGEKDAGLSPGVNVPCNLDDLLLEVVINPDADAWFGPIVKGTLSKFGYENVEVSKSSIR